MPNEGYSDRLREGRKLIAGKAMIQYSEYYIQSGAAGSEKGFDKCFLKVLLACLGSMAAAVQLNCLGNSRNTFYKTFGTSWRPRLYVRVQIILHVSLINSLLQLEQLKRRKRSISHHRSERSAELGVESGYEVVSEADLAFSPDDEDLNVAVLKVI